MKKSLKITLLVLTLLLAIATIVGISMCTYDPFKKGEKIGQHVAIWAGILLALEILVCLTIKVVHSVVNQIPNQPKKTYEQKIQEKLNKEKIKAEARKNKLLAKLNKQAAILEAKKKVLA